MFICFISISSRSRELRVDAEILDFKHRQIHLNSVQELPIVFISEMRRSQPYSVISTNQRMLMLLCGWEKCRVNRLTMTEQYQEGKGQGWGVLAKSLGMGTEFQSSTLSNVAMISIANKVMAREVRKI